jgi:hypothetical protein
MAAVCEGYRGVVVYLNCRFGNLRTRPANGLARRQQLPPINTQIADQMESNSDCFYSNHRDTLLYMPPRKVDGYNIYAWRLDGMQGPHDLSTKNCVGLQGLIGAFAGRAYQRIRSRNMRTRLAKTIHR